MRFDELFYNDDLLDALWDMHFDECTPVQEKTIPLILKGDDIVAVAQTGTGKTAAYVLPILERLYSGNFPDDKINCIIIAPTRELAQQIDKQIQGFSYFTPISSIPIYGGTDGDTFSQQRKALNMGADVVICTPGRLMAHLNMGYVDLSAVSFLILDEADRMLDMGFYDDIMKIVKLLPVDRQTLLFSATMPPKIRKLANNVLKNPSEVILSLSKPAEKILQSSFICHEVQKELILNYILKQYQRSDRVIVFASSKLKVRNLWKSLKNNRFNVGEIHSDLTQDERDKAILDFKSGKINLLIATDIVARGIDIDDILLVVNFDVPSDPEDYIHRIGRTARANATGRAITLVAEKDFPKFRRIEKFLGHDVNKETVPTEFGDTPVYNKVSERKKKSPYPNRRRFNFKRAKNRKSE